MAYCSNDGIAMLSYVANITIRLGESLKALLRVRAARHGRSIEEEARAILNTALNGTASETSNLAESIRARFAGIGGVEIPEIPRDPMGRPPRLGK